MIGLFRNSVSILSLTGTKLRLTDPELELNGDEDFLGRDPVACSLKVIVDPKSLVIDDLEMSCLIGVETIAEEFNQVP